MQRETAVCQAPTCDRPVRSARVAYCSMHCQRLRKHGSLDKPTRKTGRNPTLACADCGRLRYAGPTTLPQGQHRCLDCKRRRRIRACKTCGKEFRSKNVSHAADTEHCSVACSVPTRAASKRKAPLCEVCGQKYVKLPNRTCGWECRRAREMAQKKPPPPSNYRRRAKYFGVRYEEIAREVVFERDKWRCKICKTKVDPSAKPPSPLCPTIDHIIPMSLGGPHLSWNLQTACWRCNVTKSNTFWAAA